MYIGLPLAVFLAPYSQPNAPDAFIAVSIPHDEVCAPTRVIELFDAVGRMDYGHFHDHHVWFDIEGKRNLPPEMALGALNFRDGRRDNRPIKVEALKRLTPSKYSIYKIAYVATTSRSMWFDRGETASSFTESQQTWLITFDENEITYVREAQELSQLLFNEEGEYDRALLNQAPNCQTD